MSQRPLALCRSLSDSGFEVTTGESEPAYYNARLLLRQDRGSVGNKMRSGEDARRQRTAMTWAREHTTRESKACVMDHSLGVLDMVLESITREFEAPMESGSDDSLSTNPPSYDSITEVKAINSHRDDPYVDETTLKAFHRASTEDNDNPLGQDVVLRSQNEESLSDDDVRHLIQSVNGLHKKLDLLQSKMNGLLNQKPGREKTEDDQEVLHKRAVTDHQVSAQKNIGSSAGHTFGKKLFPKDSIYVQIEQVYYNLQRMHFPGSAMNDFFQGFRPWPMKQQKQSQMGVSASTQTPSDPNEDIESLKRNCNRLQKENAALRDELRSLRQLKDKTPPVPAPRCHRENQRVLQPMREQRQRTSTQASTLYTLVDCVAGSPTTPSQVLRIDIRITEVTYEWTIHEYSRQFQEQRCGQALKTKSAPFFIKHNGYSVRMEAYLDGDGDAKGSHLSVFLRMLPGEWDKHLAWPVHLKLSFILINQSDTCEGSIKTIVEHTYSRPKNSCISNSSGQDCWGVLDLASHDLIRSNQFIYNDTLLLQCRVHILSP